MALIGFTDFQRKIPNGKIFVANTSFLIKSLTSTIEGKLLAKLKVEFLKKSSLVYNVTIRNEILHFLRSQMIKNAVESKNITPNNTFMSFWKMKKDDHNLLKLICDQGYAEIFRSVFGENGEKLEEQFNITTYGCDYGSPKSGKEPTWKDVHKIMSVYGLDSSDAMILNMAISDSTYSGLITCDRDFRVCGNIPELKDFDIILDDKARHLPTRAWN